MFTTRNESCTLPCAFWRADLCSLLMRSVKLIADTFTVCTVITFHELPILEIAPQTKLNHCGHIKQKFGRILEIYTLDVSNSRNTNVDSCSKVSTLQYNKLPLSTPNTDISFFTVVLLAIEAPMIAAPTHALHKTISKQRDWKHLFIIQI